MKRLLLITLVALIAAAGFIGFQMWRGLQGVAPETLEATYLTQADRYVEAGGVRFRVREEGPASAPVVVMVHGFSLSLESWDAWAADLARDFRVIRFDLPGHGLTGPDLQERYSNAQTVDAVAALIDALEIEQPVLVGNSLGGLVAWRYAASHPDAVAGLILIAPGGYPINGVTDEPVAVPGAVAAYLRLAPEAGVTQAYAALYGDPTRLSRERVIQVHALMRGRGVGEALVKRLEVFTLPNPDADLARVTAPTLVLWGARDVMIAPEQAARFDSALPDADVIVYEGLGHVPHEEAAQSTLVDARAFLARVAH